MLDEFMKPDISKIRPLETIFFEILRAERKAIAIAFVLTLCVLAALFPVVPKYYSSAATIVMSFADEDVVSEGARAPKGPVDVGAILTQVQIIKSRAVLEQVVTRLRLLEDPVYNPGLSAKGWRAKLFGSESGRKDPLYDAVSILQRHLEVEQDHKAYTVTIRINSPDPLKASLIANSIAEVYRETELGTRRESVKRMTDGLGQRYAILEEKARRSREALQGFIAEFPVVEPAWAASAERELAALSEEHARAALASSEVAARARALADMAEAGTADGAPEVLNSRIIQLLKERELRINNSNRIGVSEHELAEIKRDINAEVRRLVNAVQSEAAIARTREGRIRAEIERLRAGLSERARLELRLAELRKESETDDAVLRDAAVRFKTQTHALELLEPGIKIVSPAVPPTLPSFPSLPLFGAGAVLSALIAGVAAAFCSRAAKAGRRFAGLTPARWARGKPQLVKKEDVV